MSTTYAKSQTTAQKKDASSASSVFDASSQSESLQRKADLANNATQRAEAPRPNNTGMPDNLKSGIESLSGFSMDDVRVHYNSSKPATVQALAYTQGTDIHVAPGQEKCLPHEAWHVAQQMAGRVSPTTNINGMPVNDNAALEHEADVMGEKAVQCKIDYAFIHSLKKQPYSNTAQMSTEYNSEELDEKLSAKSSSSEVLFDDIFNSFKTDILDDNLPSSVKKSLFDAKMSSAAKLDRKKSVLKTWFMERVKSYKSFEFNRNEDYAHQFAQDCIVSAVFNNNPCSEPPFTVRYQFSEFLTRTTELHSEKAEPSKKGSKKKIAPKPSKKCSKKKIAPKPKPDEKDSKKKIAPKIVPVSPEKKITKLYRTLKNGGIKGKIIEGIGFSDTDSYTKIDLLGGGHFGSIGIALNYYLQYQGTHRVYLIEIELSKEINPVDYTIGSDGEGLDAKTEDTSALPYLKNNSRMYSISSTRLTKELSARSIEATEVSPEKVAEAPHEMAAEAPHEMVAEAPHEMVAEAPHEMAAEAPHEMVAEAPHEMAAEAPHEMAAEAPHEMVAEAPHEMAAEAPHEMVTVKGIQVLKTNAPRVLREIICGTKTITL